MPVKVVTWMFFTVGIALLPLVFNRVLNKYLSWKDFLSDGQLLLVGIAIDAEAIGDMMSTGIDGNIFRSIVAGMNFLVVISSCLVYPACLDINQRKKLSFSAHQTSLILFSLSLITSICCKLISKS